MLLETTQAYITTVDPNRTIVLPDTMTVGSTVAVVIMPANIPKINDTVRQERFATTLAAIRTALATDTPSPTVSDTELDKLIKEARQASQLQ